MAEVKSVSLRGGFTVNMGNYESAKIEAEVVLELQEGEDVKDALQQARKIIDEEVGEQMTSLKKLSNVKNGRDGKILSVVAGE